jgi:hypothetical protein
MGVTAGHYGIADIADITRPADPTQHGVTFATPRDGSIRPRHRHTDGDASGYRGARKHPRPTRPMFWESRQRWRAELDERPDPPECLRGVLTTDYRPDEPPPVDVMRRRQREQAEVRSPHSARGGEAR